MAPVRARAVGNATVSARTAEWHPGPVRLPDLAPAEWSIRVVDVAQGSVLASLDARRVLRTASVGKLFLLVEAARQATAGELDLTERVAWQDDERVEDSGLWYLLDQRELSVRDLCVLVGAVSDNLATNVLVRVVGLVGRGRDDRCARLHRLGAARPGSRRTGSVAPAHAVGRDGRRPGRPHATPAPPRGRRRRRVADRAALDRRQHRPVHGRVGLRPRPAGARRTGPRRSARQQDRDDQHGARRRRGCRGTGQPTPHTRSWPPGETT